MDHYNSVAADYDSAFFYGDRDYRDWLLSHLVPIFKSSVSEGFQQVTDIGGGTGNFTQAIAEALHIPKEKTFLCVDPFIEMLEKAAAYRNVETVLMDALSFSKAEYSYRYALMKEVIHHIPEESLDTLFSGVLRQLHEDGLCVIITRPQEVNYPFFPRAAEIWKENQPSSSIIIAALERAGFQVDMQKHSYLVQVQKSSWLKMISNRFWSTFSLCSDDEISSGIEYLSEKYSAEESLSFDDTLLFIIARKIP